MTDFSTKKYGVDIALRRADDLDRKALVWVKQKVQAGMVPSILDLGCGAGGQAVRMADVGACVMGVDIGEYQRDFVLLHKQYNIPPEQLRFLQGDMRRVHTIIYDSVFDMCVMQRVLHYVPYGDALTVLSELKNAGIKKLFISVTGIESDIGRNYKGVHQRIHERFCMLKQSDQATFAINQPVCLYTPEEFMVLLQESGWEIEESWVSAFGNIKAVCA